MKVPTQQILSILLLVSPAIAQSKSSVREPKPELSLTLQPERLKDGLPEAFTFVLTNVGGQELRVPPPDIDCSTATVRGTLWLDESWQPPSGLGLAKGLGSCDFGGTGRPSALLVEVAQKWTLLRAGESMYITASNTALHYESTGTGTYTFSATYSPPELPAEALQKLREAGILVPRGKALSESVRYRVD